MDNNVEFQNSNYSNWITILNNLKNKLVNYNTSIKPAIFKLVQLYTGQGAFTFLNSEEIIKPGLEDDELSHINVILKFKIPDLSSPTANSEDIKADVLFLNSELIKIRNVVWQEPQLDIAQGFLIISGDLLV